MDWNKQKKKSQLMGNFGKQIVSKFEQKNYKLQNVYMLKVTPKGLLIIVPNLS